MMSIDSSPLENRDISPSNNKNPSLISKNENPILVFTAAIYVISFVVIGLPLWWITTNVYRVSLPYSEIEKLPSLQISHLIPITVILADRNVHQSSLWEKLSLLTFENPFELERQPLQIRYAWKMRTILEEEEAVLRKSKNIFDLDAEFHNLYSLTDVGVYNVLVVDANLSFPVSEIVGCQRRSYVVSLMDTDVLAEKIISVAKTMSQAEFLKKLYNPPSSYKRKLPEKDKMRFLSPTTAFDITFSLMVPEPHIINVQWDIQNAINAYILPFTSKLSLIYDVDIKSQILYMMSLPIKSMLDMESTEHVLSVEQLPLLINPIEAKLGSYASVNPTLNFVIYIVPQDMSPLIIIDEKGQNLPTNAFLSPQWGGILIKNIELTKNNVTLPQDISLDMQEVMEVFLGQLKLLVGLPNMENLKDKSPQITATASCCEWELDFLLRKNTQEQLSFAVSSLHSLGQLLHTINNIVIRDEIGELIYYSLSSIKHSINGLQQGFLEEGFLYARRAFNASESAFFDPSLLALLYFPDDQKYAIYIPLFLPVSIPVIMSFRQLWSYWSQRKKVKTE